VCEKERERKRKRERVIEGEAKYAGLMPANL
jgi:hypothetical protein